MTIKETIMARKINNPHDLTEEEIEFLRSAKVSNEVKGYLARQHENIGTKISAYRKVAAAANAECDALLAVRALQEAQDEAATIERVQSDAAVLAQQNRALESAVAKKDAEIMRLKVTPALAVHS